MPTAVTSRGTERVLRNFIKTHGREALVTLIDGLKADKSGQVLADELGVTRERIRQWKNAFGERVVIYKVHPAVNRALGQPVKKPANPGPKTAKVLQFDSKTGQFSAHK